MRDPQYMICCVLSSYVIVSDLFMHLKIILPTELLTYCWIRWIL